jgi:hypothetical protein
MKLCKILERKKEELEKKENYVIKNKIFVKWIKEDLEIMKKYCNVMECPTNACKEIMRIHKDIYKY